MSLPSLEAMAAWRPNRGGSAGALPGAPTDPKNTQRMPTSSPNPPRPVSCTLPRPLSFRTLLKLSAWNLVFEHMKKSM